MRVTVVRDDGLVGVDGVFRSVNLSGLPEGVRVMQWDGEGGHVEYDNEWWPNERIGAIEVMLPFVDLWISAAPAYVPPTSAELIAAAHARINQSYEIEVNALTTGYPQTEIDSWAKQESEARAWLADNNALTPWIDGAAASRNIAKETLVALIIGNADALAPLHGALTGKRQKLRDAIDALGPNATQQQLNSIVWQGA
jgi:hypothetical protein